MLKRLLPSKAYSGVATTNEPSVSSGVVSTPLAYALKVSGIGGTTPTVDVKVQESPDPVDAVTDASAVWFDLVTFTQRTTNGNEKKTAAAPSFSRRRTVVTLGGTAPVATVEVIEEA